ncbi:MAG: diaminopimelate epimerase [Bacteroidota bacterium]
MGMVLEFVKYQGAGNDFILIDNREGHIQLNTEQIARLCHRNFGIGADGLILLCQHLSLDFKMVYYNSDGKESTMCGNGGRCIVQFAYDLNAIGPKTQFEAIDGLHQAHFEDTGIVSLHMKDVADIEQLDPNTYVLDTGSPHYVQFVENLKALDVYHEGKAIRNSDRFVQEGINVNFVEITGEEQLKIRTYERGIEQETLACGTGITAAALSYISRQGKKEAGTFEIELTAQSGDHLKVRGKNGPNGFTDINLIGPAQKVFSGHITI